MNTRVRIPAFAPCAATAPARFPVDGQAMVSMPNSSALVAAIETTRSLNEYDGLTASFFNQRFSIPRSLPSRSAEERGEAGADVHGPGPAHREQGLVPVDRVRAVLDAGAADLRLDGVVVVVDLERPKAEFADVQGLDWVVTPALTATQGGGIGQPGSPVSAAVGTRVQPGEEQQQLNKLADSPAAEPPGFRIKGTHGGSS